jgi:hypothetical protein
MGSINGLQNQWATNSCSQSNFGGGVGSTGGCGGQWGASEILGRFGSQVPSSSFGGPVGNVFCNMQAQQMDSTSGSHLGGEMGNCIEQHHHHQHGNPCGGDSPMPGGSGGSYPSFGGGYGSPYNGPCEMPQTSGRFPSPLSQSNCSGGYGGGENNYGSLGQYGGGQSYGGYGGSTSGGSMGFGGYGGGNNYGTSGGSMGYGGGINCGASGGSMGYGGYGGSGGSMNYGSSGGGMSNYGSCQPYQPGNCSSGTEYGAGQPWSGGNCSPGCGSPTCGTGTSNGQPTTGTLTQTADGQPATYTDPNGWSVSMSGSTVTITDPSGKHTVQNSGDPHEQVDGTYMGGVNGAAGGSGQWNGTAQTIKLPDGTQVTMNANAFNQPIQSTSIFVPGENGQGAREIQYNNNSNSVTSQSFNAQQVYQDQANTVQGQAEGIHENSQGMTVNSLYNQTSLGNTTADFGTMAFSPTQQTYQSTLNNPNTFTGSAPVTPSMYINYNTQALAN